MGVGEMTRSAGTIVTGVIGDDVHNIGIKVIEHALRHAGFNVVSLGIRISDEEFIEAALETKADAILVSSLSGHARALATGLRDKSTEAGLGDILLYIGGHLVIGQAHWENIEKTFKGMGFDRVYPPSTLVANIIKDLKTDLEKTKGVTRARKQPEIN
jgi:methylaspartate mutase sigma subunit